MKGPKTVYLIDDDNDDLDLFCEAVHSIDDSIVCIKSNDSEASLKAFKENILLLPDLIFLDLNMPVINGRDVLKQLRDIDTYSDIPIIIYSTSSHPKDIEETRQLGASGFLPKPYSVNELIKELNNLLFRNWSKHEGTESFYSPQNSLYRSY